MAAIIEKYNARVDEVNSLLCVGLDTLADTARRRFPNSEKPQLDFNRWIIDQTGEFVAAFKPNVSFYEAEGKEGWEQLQETIDYIRTNFPNAVTIGDAKRGDIDSSNAGYVKSLLDKLGFDAITLNPYLGRQALTPFLSRFDKGFIVLCKTSNQGAGELQDQKIEGGKRLWQVVAENVSNEWNTEGNCMLVVGATYPADLEKVREIVGEMTLLVPGVGTQGGKLEDVMAVGQNSEGKGLIINASRAITNDADPGTAARDLRDQINEHRQ